MENIAEIFSTFDSKHMSNGIMRDRMLDYGAQSGSEPYSTLMGWGAFFRKDWISVFDRYIERFGEDCVLHREADRIFTVLLASRHNTVPTRAREFPSAHQEMALYRQPDHERCKGIAVERAMRIVRESRAEREGTIRVQFRLLNRVVAAANWLRRQLLAM